jgi:hypothetical protein
MLGLGGWWAAGWGLRQPAGLPRALGAAVLAWAWVTLGVLILGLVGWLARGPLLAWAAAGLAMAAMLRLALAAPGEAPDPGGGSWEISATVAIGLGLWAAVVIGVAAWMFPVKTATDAPIYHLYFAARWWKAGQVFLVSAPFGDTAVTYLPTNGELWFAALMTLWGGDLLAKVGQVPFLLMAASAAFAIARRLGVGRSAAAIAASWFVACMPVLLFSFEANVDTIFVAGYLAAAYFLLRYALGDGGLGTLAIAALAAGGTWGTKATGTVFVPLLLALGAVVILRRRTPIGAKLAHLTALALLPMVMAGYWFGRNAWLTGNPLYPLQVSALGRVCLRGWFDPSAMRLSEFYIPPDKLRALADILLLVFDPRLAPVWAAGLLGVWAIGRKEPLSRWIAVVSTLAVADIALYWLLIPYRTQQRFMLPAVGLATVPLAALFDRAKWVRWGAVGLLGLHLLTPQTWPATPLGAQVPWGLSHEMVSTPYGIIRIPLTSDQLNEALADATSTLYLAATVAVGLGALVAAAAWTSLARNPSAARWAVAITATAALVALPSVATWRYLTASLTFPEFPLYDRGWKRLEQLAGPEGARIAYAGTNRAYYLMGHDLRNDVVYVNIDTHHGWRLHDYHRQAIARGHPNWPDPRPGWDRLEPDYPGWLSNLAAERVDLLVVTPANPRDGLFNLADRAGFPIERVWADAHPEVFTLVYGAVERDPNFRIYRVHQAVEELPSSSGSSNR